MTAEPVEIPTGTRFAGFRRRLLGSVVDLTVLGLIGSALGLALYPWLVSLGAWARLPGFGIATLYFGVLGGRLADGRSPGARLLSLRVVDRLGGPLTLGRGFLRSVLLSAGLTLAGLAEAPRVEGSVLAVAISGLGWGVGIADLWLLFSCRKSGQTLHDRVAGAYVVHVPSAPPGDSTQSWKPNALIVVVLAVAASAALAGSLGWWEGRMGEGRLVRLNEAILKSGDVVRSSVFDQAMSSWSSDSGKMTEHNLLITIQPRGSSADAETIAGEAAEVALRTDPAFAARDQIVVIVTTGYDMGIASAWQRTSIAHTPAQWRSRLRSSSPNVTPRSPLPGSGSSASAK